MTHPRLAHLRALCLEGGAMRAGGTYPAALEALEPHLPPHLRGWRVPIAAGTSAGAIAALAVALRLPLREVLDSIPWGSIAPRFRVWGRTDRLRDCIAGMLARAHVPQDITLAEFPERTGCALHVAVRELSWRPHRTLLLGPEVGGDIPVADAVTASAALPIVFRPVRLGRLVLWDGGLGANYPFDLILQRHRLIPEQMLGLRVDRPGELTGGHYQPVPRNPLRLLRDVVAGLAAENNAHVPEELWASRTVRVILDAGLVGVTDFEPSPAQRVAMDRAGREGAQRWLERRAEAA